MTRQEFDSHKWTKFEQIITHTFIGWAVRREVLAVDFETQSVQVTGFLWFGRVWVFCGDFEFVK